MNRKVNIGTRVKVKDEFAVEHDALVTNAWPDGVEYDDAGTVNLAINVVFVSSDPSKQDQYGRQTEHLTSVMHRSACGDCPGRHWWQE